MWSSLLTVFGAVVLVGGKVYEPCDLLISVKQFLRSVGKPHTWNVTDREIVDLTMCIAGYMYYDTSYSIVSKNGTRYYGIFGIYSPDTRICAGKSNISEAVQHFTDDDAFDDFECLMSRVLRTPSNRETYKTLCSPLYVQHIKCPVTPYFAEETIVVPTKKRAFSEAILTGRNPIDVLQEMTSSSGAVDSSWSLFWPPLDVIVVSGVVAVVLLVGIVAYIILNRRRARRRTTNNVVSYKNPTPTCRVVLRHYPSDNDVFIDEFRRFFR